MFQEYRDWEKAFQKHTADENANIDTNKLWHNLKDHVPAKNKQNRWLPFLLIISLLSLALTALMWTQNLNLKAANKSLVKELSANKKQLLACKTQPQNHNSQNDQISKPSDLVSANGQIRRLNHNQTFNLFNSSKNNFPRVEIPVQHLVHQNENAPTLTPLRETMIVSSIDTRKMSVIDESELVLIPVNKHKRKYSVAPPAGFLKLALTGGGSGQKGSYLSPNLIFVNNTNFQLGLQFNAAKYLNRNWYLGAHFNYFLANNVSNYISTTTNRNETTGTTEIVIDGNGNVSSSNGIKGATSYHRVKAELYNLNHQILLGPGFGYTFLWSDKNKLNFHASAQWLLFSHFSGKTPLGSEHLTGGQTHQWIYKLKYPQLGLGVDWNHQLSGKYFLSIGLYTGFLTDQLSLNEMVLNRKGIFYNGHLGLQKYF
ncbi:MAG: hypothetical protein KA340_02985 [Saprospiraceae bacterium]|jgi:hypothetical protein|nr:hypothetical protein [Saprospiraceae bacterium]